MNRRTFIENLSLASAGVALIGPQVAWGEKLFSQKASGFLYDPVHQQHDLAGHPETAQRANAIYSFLKEKNLLKKMKLFRSRLADQEELELVHSPSYIKEIAQLKATGYLRREKWSPYYNSNSSGVARAAAGGCIDLATKIYQGKVVNGFALVRPPGHHAHRDRPSGFCIFNNVALAARALQKKNGLERITIIDLDVHHGDGTQSIFYLDPGVQYISIHQEGIFPFTGKAEETGSKEGMGTTINVPLPPFSGDSAYNIIFSQVIEPLVKRFKPQIIFVSFGADTHWRDYMSTMNVTCTGMRNVAQQIKNLAEAHCSGKLMTVLEGGYNLQALAEGSANWIAALSGEKSDSFDSLSSSGVSEPEISELIKKVCKIHSIQII